MVTRWTFFDPYTSETYTFAINPNEGGTPGLVKKIEYQTAAAPDGAMLVFEGRDDPKKIDFSGTILEQAQLDAFIVWFGKRNKIRLTDDLGRQFWVYLTSFNPTRGRKASHPWRHTYQASAAVIS
jgi:hypothetical protein